MSLFYSSVISSCVTYHASFLVVTVSQPSFYSCGLKGPAPPTSGKVAIAFTTYPLHCLHAMSSTSPTASFRPNQRSSQTYHPQISTSTASSTASQPFSDRAPVSIARRPSRATHPPMAPPRPLTHDEALEALRAFLKERSSYDVFPVSFRLIVLDTQLKVKKALDVMLLYGK